MSAAGSGRIAVNSRPQRLRRPGRDSRDPGQDHTQAPEPGGLQDRVQSSPPLRQGKVRPLHLPRPALPFLTFLVIPPISHPSLGLKASAVQEIGRAWTAATHQDYPDDDGRPRPHRSDTLPGGIDGTGATPRGRGQVMRKLTCPRTRTRPPALGGRSRHGRSRPRGIGRPVHGSAHRPPTSFARSSTAKSRAAHRLARLRRGVTDERLFRGGVTVGDSVAGYGGAGATGGSGVPVRSRRELPDRHRGTAAKAQPSARSADADGRRWWCRLLAPRACEA